MEWDKKKQGVDQKRAERLSRGVLGGNAYKKILSDKKPSLFAASKEYDKKSK